MKKSLASRAAPAPQAFRADGHDDLWSAVEPRIRSANQRFVAGDLGYRAWCDEIRTFRATLGLEAR